jgi:hypothetical protein
MDINDKIEKFLKESDDGTGTMGYDHPHGGRGREGYNKGLTCPHCGGTINLEDFDLDKENSKGMEDMEKNK